MTEFRWLGRLESGFMPGCQQLFTEPLLGGCELRRETRQCNPTMIATERTAFHKPVKKRVGHLRVMPRLAIQGNSIPRNRRTKRPLSVELT